MDSIRVFTHILISYYIKIPYRWKEICFFADCVVAIILLILAIRKKINIKKSISILLLFAHTILVFTSTVFSRSRIQDAQIIIDVLWIFRKIYNGESYLVGELIYNVLMFIPIGILTPCVKSNINIRSISAMGLLISGTIELMQMVLKCGYFETMDIICNSIGILVGYFLCCIVRKIILNTQ